MLVLGLGSNVGNRLGYLRSALLQLATGRDPILSDVKLSLLYESDALLKAGSPADWDQPFINLAVSGNTNRQPHELLHAIKQVELEVGREARGLWAPREIDIDILHWVGVSISEPDLRIPHPATGERPFVLLPYGDVAGSLDYDLRVQLLEWRVVACTNWERSPLAARTRVMRNFENRRFFAGLEEYGITPARTADNPELVGIVNVTPDSFSDGGKFSEVDAALSQVHQMIEDGATVVDIGAESTRPGAAVVSEAEEWERLKRILGAFDDDIRSKIRLSVDSRHAEVISAALELGLDWCNDVTGFKDQKYVDLVATAECDAVVMHSLGVPPSREKTLPIESSPVEEIKHWIEEVVSRLNGSGITSDRIIVDPGIGFGKSAVQSLEILKEMAQLVCPEVRLLVGHSRKSFLNSVTDEDFANRDLETALVTSRMAAAGVDYVRVHSVRENMRALRTRIGLL